MATTSELEALLKRVEAATGSDRELDGLICIAFGWTYQRMKGDRYPYYRKPGDVEFHQRSEPPAYTSSLDACQALQKRVLPDVMERTRRGPPHEVVIPLNGKMLACYSATSMSLAWLAAILTALIAQNGEQS